MKSHDWQKLTTVWDGNLSYCEPADKVDAHKIAKKALRFIAKQLGLQPRTFEVRSNMGGIAVSGEVTLHSDPPFGSDKGYYLQIGQSCMQGIHILFRTCQHRKDYTGHQNHHFSIHRMKNATEVDQFLTMMKLCCFPLED